MEYILLKEKAIKYIGISKKTEGEVRKKLKNFSADEELINKVIDVSVSAVFIFPEIFHPFSKESEIL